MQRSNQPNNRVKSLIKNNTNKNNRHIVVIILSFLFFAISGQSEGQAMELELVDRNNNNIDTSNNHANLPVSSTVSSFVSSATRILPTSSSSSTPTIAPSTLSQDGEGDFTAQAALSLTRATQTNNIVNSKSYYDISFRTATAGIIKHIQMAFPPETFVGSTVLIEAVGIGPGTIAASGSPSTGQTLTYTVTNEVNVPALTRIRIQIANANNPQDPSNSLTVTITTRDSANNIIDGPTATNAYNIKQIGTADIADNAVTSSKIADGTIGDNDLNPSLMISRFLLDNSRGASFGWNPNGLETDFIIFDEAVSGSNAVLINVGDSDSNSQCEALGALSGFFTILCNNAPPQGSELRYTIINIPLS
jgi:hypothetical protein